MKTAVCITECFGGKPQRAWIVRTVVPLCTTSRAVTVANFRADVPAASVIRVVYTSNNLLLTPATRGIVNITDVRWGRWRTWQNCIASVRKDATTDASESILIIPIGMRRPIFVNLRDTGYIFTWSYLLAQRVAQKILLLPWNNGSKDYIP